MTSRSDQSAELKLIVTNTLPRAEKVTQDVAALRIGCRLPTQLNTQVGLGRRFSVEVRTAVEDENCWEAVMATARVAIAPMKVAQIRKGGADFEIVEREIPNAAAVLVRIKAQACGFHSDVLTKEGVWPGI
jgi:hypothetical protein